MSDLGLSVRVLFGLALAVKPIAAQNLPWLHWWGWISLAADVWIVAIWLISLPWWGWTIAGVLTVGWLLASGVIAILEGSEWQ